ncbi:NADH-quinone oxidoreductase subunit I [Desulfobotulus sp. H1]|uniref:NADH-quinone oxidoreductase subunit I n=1 Tax=Desulfobotulus pelophilus TaxID=2823377 RepID=A0ABT3N763_9BACT|nr:NADH-quinone oxidoreductase subunit I [Desulfobotulus pelophilus]MCW7753297.1 NADH-quinone oxidoreductase subunit I [Desulfobotulus pelophilus]
MSGYFSDLYHGTKSLLVGLGVTFKEMVKPTVTVHYPRETIVITPNYRGHIELVIDEETGGSRCITCGMCARACPSDCITVLSEKPEGAKKKVLTGFELDFTRCSLCGICVESCPTDAITYSQDYNLAGFSREEFHMDLLGRLGKGGSLI